MEFGGYEFAREALSDSIIAEMSPLTERHWSEVAHFKDIPLSVCWADFIAADKNGGLRTFTARLSGKLVGYCVFFVRHNGHYSSSLQASQDVVFIAPEHRGFGRLFIDWCDSQLREEGVQVTAHHVKLAHNWGRMLESLGYERVEIIYQRRLDKTLLTGSDVSNVTSQEAH